MAISRMLQGDEGEPGLRRWASRGATNTEYLILLMAGTMVILGGIKAFGGGLDTQYEDAAGTVSSASDRGGGGAASASAGRSGQADGATGGEASEDGDEVVHTGEVDRETRAMGDGTGGGGEGDSDDGMDPLVFLLLSCGVLGLVYLFVADD